MRRYLIVANQTLGGPELLEEIRERIQAGPCAFHVVVPDTAPEDLSASWVPPDPLFGVGAGPDAREVELARRRVRERLDRMLERLSGEGAQATGEVGDPDPLRAVEEALADREVDGIILSTLPPGISRWLGMDLPSRLVRRVEVPVTTVVAEK